jgi:Phage minor structural protein GP20.
MLDFIKQIIAKHTDEATGKVDIEAVMNEVNKTAPEHIVPKDQYNVQADQLKEAQATLEALQKDNKDNEKLQSEVSDWKNKYEQSVKDSAITNFLVEAGAKDVDYAKFKLGEVELENGNVKNADKVLKSLKESIPEQFEAEKPKDDPKDKPPGYQVHDTKLGRNADTKYSMDEIKSMSTEQINENWEAVSASMNEGGQ